MRISDWSSDVCSSDLRDRYPLLVVGEAGEERLLEPLDAEHRVATSGVEVEGPAAGVVGRARDPHRQGALEPQQPAHDDRSVGPAAGPRDHEARSEEPTSELQSLMRSSNAVF